MDLYFLEVILHVCRVYHTRGTVPQPATNVKDF
jgi:hypothetical protein